MGQAEYNAFKERMKQWMLENADIYDEFEEMMNSQNVHPEALASSSREGLCR
jgi:hypothetical protein